jgi:AcrR family transcriptional regulator
MSNKNTTPKSIKKSNSPVSKTGQGATIKKRLLHGKDEDLLKGRENILLGARSCFAKHGFAGTSMKDIQIAAGCSRGNLYHFFKTKSEIVQTITTQNLERFCERIEFILEESNDRAIGLSEVIEDLAGYAEEITKGPGKGMAFHVWSLAMVDQDVRATMVQYFERIRFGIEKKISVMIKNGQIPNNKNTQNLSVVLFGVLIPSFTLQSVFMDGKSLDASQYSESIQALFKEI